MILASFYFLQLQVHKPIHVIWKCKCLHYIMYHLIQIIEIRYPRITIAPSIILLSLSNTSIVLKSLVLSFFGFLDVGSSIKDVAIGFYF